MTDKERHATWTIRMTGDVMWDSLRMKAAMLSIFFNNEKYKRTISTLFLKIASVQYCIFSSFIFELFMSRKST